LERRFVVVERRDRGETLIPIVQEEAILGTTTVTDEWKPCACLKDIGFVRYTVNHSQYFIDPIKSYNTQTIECLWSMLKLKISRKMHGTIPELLHRHLIDGHVRTGQLT